jgi:hypothetical protein
MCDWAYCTTKNNNSAYASRNLWLLQQCAKCSTGRLGTNSLVLKQASSGVQHPADGEMFDANRQRAESWRRRRHLLLACNESDFHEIKKSTSAEALRNSPGRENVLVEYALSRCRYGLYIYPVGDENGADDRKSYPPRTL